MDLYEGTTGEDRYIRKAAWFGRLYGTDPVKLLDITNMQRPLNAELTRDTLAEAGAIALDVRLQAMGIALEDLAPVKLVLEEVLNSWEAKPASHFARALATTSWAEAEARANVRNTKYLLQYKYFCAPRIQFNEEVSKALNLPYNNGAKTAVVDTHTLSTLREIGNWDDAHKAFFEVFRGLRLVGMDSGCWLVESEETRLN